MKRLSIPLSLVLLVFPLTILAAFHHYPAVKSLVDSFWKAGTARRPGRFAGFEYYERMLTDDKLHQVLWNNVIYSSLTIPTVIFLAIGMALLVNAKLPGTWLMRTSFFLPTMMPLIAIANIWMFFYAPGFGLIAQLLSYFGLPPMDFLNNSDTSLASIMAVSVWHQAGLYMIFYLAALQSVPNNLKEAAKLEGASSIRVFFDVVLPLLMPTTIFVSVNALIGSFRTIDHIIVMTNGGPNNSTALLLFYLYDVTFTYRDFSYGATLTVFMIFLLGFIALVQFRFLDRRAHYR